MPDYSKMIADINENINDIKNYQLKQGYKSQQSESALQFLKESKACLQLIEKIENAKSGSNPKLFQYDINVDLQTLRTMRDAIINYLLDKNRLKSGIFQKTEQCVEATKIRAGSTIEKYSPRDTKSDSDYENIDTESETELPEDDGELVESPPSYPQVPK